MTHIASNRKLATCKSSSMPDNKQFKNSLQLYVCGYDVAFTQPHFKLTIFEFQMHPVTVFITCVLVPTTYGSARQQKGLVAVIAKRML